MSRERDVDHARNVLGDAHVGVHERDTLSRCLSTGDIRDDDRSATGHEPRDDERPQPPGATGHQSDRAAKLHSAPVTVACEHELLGQRDARRR